MTNLNEAVSLRNPATSKRAKVRDGLALTQGRMRLHVTPRPAGKFAVRREGGLRASSVEGSLPEAMTVARRRAGKGGRIYVHRSDGTVKTVETVA